MNLNLTSNTSCKCYSKSPHYCERFKPRSHFISRWNMIVQVNVVLNRTIVDSDWCFNNLCRSHLQSRSGLYHVSWWYWTLLIDLIGQLSCFVIGRRSVKPWCYWLWILLVSHCHGCISIRLFVTVKQSFIVSQIIGHPVILSLSVCFSPSISHLHGAGNFLLQFIVYYCSTHHG